MSTSQVSGGKTIDITLSGTVTSGDIWEGTDRAGVYVNSGVSGDVVPAAVCGVFTVAKKTGEAFTVGQKIYSDAGNQEATGTSTSNPVLGTATAAAASGATTATVLLES